MDSEVMLVKEIREEDSRGRHTTTHRQLFMLPGGAMIIDTPGMRELGLFDADDGISAGFTDIEELIPRCRFNDCRHQTEPGCAVAAALEAGTLSRGRWQSYLTQRSENRFVAGKAAKKRDKSRRGDSQPSKRKSEPDYRHEASFESFKCKACGAPVMPEGAGSKHRNHCPQCLCSVHVDDEPGDRASGCLGVMEPISAWVRKDGEWALIHRCRVCGALSSNRVTADDNPMLLMSIAVKPLSAPPFPLSMLGTH
jgi:ribosome biogenesis GTPase